MSRNRNICFLSETKTPMVEFIHKFIQENCGEKIKMFGADCHVEGGGTIFHKGVDYEEYFGDDVTIKNKKLLAWASFGGANTTWADEDGTKSMYPVKFLKKLIRAIEESGIENDVYMLITMDNGTRHKTRPWFRKLWTGRFL